MYSKLPHNHRLILQDNPYLVNFIYENYKINNYTTKITIQIYSTSYAL